MVLKRKELAKMIDYVLLNREATSREIEKLCRETLEYGFATVCLNPVFVPLAYSLVKGSPVKVCTPVGFPLGANTTKVKAFEAEEAIKNGAEELDMMMNIGALKEGRDDFVREDIEAVVKVANGLITKVIIETALLTKEEKVRACLLAKRAGAQFVKSSSGVELPGATVEDIKLMRETVGPDMGVKASGGINDLKTALAMIEAGANRIASRVAVSIMMEMAEVA